MSSITTELNKYWSNYLNSKIPDFTFKANRSDSGQFPPFGVCRVNEVEEILPNSNIYRIDEYQILVITSIDESDSDFQSDVFRRTKEALCEAPINKVSGNLEVFNWSGVEELSGKDEDDEHYADILQFSMGARLIS